MILATLIAPQHIRPIQPVGLLIPTTLVFSSYLSLNGYKKDAAGFVAAVVYMSAAPVRSFAFSVAWLVLVLLVGILMISTWRYPSFKQINISKPRTPLIVLVIGGIAFLIWEWSQPVLLAASFAYLLSGVVIRLSGVVKRHTGTRIANPPAEKQVG